MTYTMEDIHFVEMVLARFYDIGVSEAGGVTRLGYTSQEDAMHTALAQLGEELGVESYIDEVGNSYLSNCGRSQDAYFLGSHLDSVVNGGRYDGVAGVISGLLVMRWAQEKRVRISLRIAAFRCEESSNFGVSTIGSGLITGNLLGANLAALKGRDGILLGEMFAQRGYSLSPKQISSVKEYLEIHIEQGRALHEYKQKLGIVTTIAGPRRFRIHIQGRAEHSGATPMAMRNDALCAAAELILEIERIGIDESVRHSVATVGMIENIPNALNVVPGEVRLYVDTRSVEKDSLDEMERRIKQAGRSICAQRGAGFICELIGDSKPIDMNQNMQDKLACVAQRLDISHRRMMSGAGHDAMNFAQLCDTAMLFIPCRDGASHNKSEFCHMESICDAAKVAFEYLKEGVTGT